MLIRQCHHRTSQVWKTIVNHGVDPQHDPDVGTLPLKVINFKFRCLFNVVECIGGGEDEQEGMRHLWWLLTRGLSLNVK